MARVIRTSIPPETSAARKLVRRGVDHERPAREDETRRAMRQALADVVVHQDDVLPVWWSSREQLLDGDRGGGVEAVERFVGEQQVGRMDERPGDGDALGHAAAEGLDGIVGAIEETDGDEKLVGAFRGIGMP